VGFTEGVFIEVAVSVIVLTSVLVSVSDFVADMALVIQAASILSLACLQMTSSKTDK
jgi:hypothetical protein